MEHPRTGRCVVSLGIRAAFLTKKDCACLTGREATRHAA